MTMAERLADAQSVQLPYLIVAGVLVVLAIVIARFNLPALGTATRRAAAEERKHHSLWRHRNLVFGIPAIFIYLIAEIGVSNLRSEEHTSELQSLMRISYAAFCLYTKTNTVQ